MADTIVAFILIGGSLCYLLLCGLCRAAARRRPTKNAAPAPVSPARVQARALTPAQHLCSRRGHAIPDWAHHDGLWFCVRECGYTAPRHPREELPYDQAAVQLVVEAEAFLRRVS